MIDIDNIAKLPEPIHESLISLSKNINITHFSDKGGNGYLFFGKNHLLNKDVAIKYYYYDHDKDYHAEPKYLASFESKNILKIHHAETINDDCALFITDFCKNGDLDDFMIKNQISVKTALTMTHELLQGVCDLHSKKLVHRDLKPQNLFIDDNKNIVIGDFGSVKKIPDGIDSIPGSGHSVLYRPPEANINNNYYYNSDIYQVGIILYQLLKGKLLYNETDYLDDKQRRKYDELQDYCDKTIFVDSIIKDKITRGKLLDFNSLPVWIDSQLIRIIKKATNINPKKRYATCSEMMLDITKIKKHVLDWNTIDNGFIVNAETSFRIICEKDFYHVEKHKHSSWKRVNTINESQDYKTLIQEVTKLLKKNNYLNYSVL